MKKTSLFAICFVALVAVAAWVPNLYADCCGCVDCSPGFYKNHVEVWDGVCCVDADCDALEAALNTHGKWMDPIRRAAQDYLNECFEDLGYNPGCEDDD